MFRDDQGQRTHSLVDLQNTQEFRWLLEPLSRPASHRLLRKEPFAYQEHASTKFTGTRRFSTFGRVT